MLPDPNNPDFVTFCGVIGAFMGVTWARWLGDDDFAPWIAKWTYLGVAFGLAGYLGAVGP